ncbi:S8 family serine peptidase [Shewanella surugensis]|uniref:S8 family serine peptidase n=1 Tax=Shewanella surugensis TaxID=212020 RepID=A0ABT0LH57_9GAMM|nr:S8 family serine peptidase [Shewanella surugensis]MCL1127039.1 S8 family serine peptidase [Shewanella surugensis]
MNNVFKLSSLSAVVLLAITGCGGGSDHVTGSEGSSENTALSVADVEIKAAKHWLPVEASLGVDQQAGDTFSVIFKDGDQLVKPEGGVYYFSHGTLNMIDNKSFRYISLTGEDAEITYTVTVNNQSASAAILISDVISDPLANQQWHLRNTGQKAYALNEALGSAYIQLLMENGFSEEDATVMTETWYQESIAKLIPDEDMNVVEAFAYGVTGQGMTAVVVDTGLEINHEDLITNILPNRSLNLDGDAINKMDPTSISELGDHGTSVAGLIAAEGWNGLGGRGVAPDTKLIGMKYLSNNTNSPQADFLVHGFPGSGIASSDNIAVFNRSYGITYPTFFSYSEIDESIASYPSLNLREGKGALNIKASGNGFNDDGAEGSICLDNGANALGLTCYSSSFELSQAHPYYLSVAAVNTDGKHASYSTAGANIFVSAPAGEYGRWAPAMITTDQMSCLKGYASFNSRAAQYYGEDLTAQMYPFNYPAHDDNLSCNYTSTFNGTSSAAPNVSGVVSLILAANPELTWRDVRHILVSTSSHVDLEDKPVLLKMSNGTFIAHDAWVTNDAGYPFNNKYGFGRVNAGAAVAMAQFYTKDLGEQVISEWQGEGSSIGDKPIAKLIKDNHIDGVSVSVEIQEDLTLEAVQFKFDVANSDMLSELIDSEGKRFNTTAGMDLAIEVISPKGTRSVLLSSKQALLVPAYSFSEGVQEGYIIKDGVFLSNAFYGESSKGTWTLRLLDTSSQDISLSEPGTDLIKAEYYMNNREDSILEGFAVRVFGH